MIGPQSAGASEQAPAVQAHGRSLLTALSAASRAMSLYPLGNAAVHNVIDELHLAVRRIASDEGMLELRLLDDFFFLNDVRLRIDVASIGAFSSVATALTRHGIGTVEVDGTVTREEWIPFLALLQNEPTDPPFETFVKRLAASAVSHIRVEPERFARQRAEDSDTEEGDDPFLSRKAAQRTYLQSVSVAREMMTDLRLGRAVNIRRIKHAVQAIVDQVLVNESAIVGMTTLKDFDEYTFTHSVNVCIFSVVLGQKLGLKKHQLYELGIAGLFHDLGKMRTDPEILKKTGALTAEEWMAMKRHPVDGLLALFSLRGFEGIPYRAMLVAYEHHMKLDLSGYPSNRRPRNPTLFSRIATVTDSFDAGTSVRSYQYLPRPPDKVLQTMRDEPERGCDPLLVKVLINVTGVYPPGTLAILDTMELAVVLGRNPDPAKIHQPVVKIISTPEGTWRDVPLQLDLSEIDPSTGQPRRQIIKTTDPERYGVNVAAYMV